MVMFNQCVDSIEKAYTQIGHTLGWRFLYSPSSTLSQDVTILFVGLNPSGGGRYVQPIASVETGNAYRVERWGNNNSQNPLQKQVCGLYKVIGNKLGGPSWEDLMDKTLAVNFCPFCSKNWKTLPKQMQSLEYSQELWESIFQFVVPPVIICISHISFNYFQHILIHLGYSIIINRFDQVGWGSVTYSQTLFIRGNQQVYLLRLPHLSRYQIMDRTACLPAINNFTDVIVSRVNSK